MASVKNNCEHGVVQPLLTDWYQVTMVYAYWKSGKTDNMAVFDLYFRKNPFQGEFTIFAGLGDCISFLENFHFSDSDLQYLRERLPADLEEDFYTYLRSLSTNDVSVYSIPEGSVVFPKVPLMRIEGPLPVVQLLETTLLNLVNFASLVATNAARFRIAAGQDKKLLEFGLRRAQGPDGAMTASKYCYVGGFDGTSNVLAGKRFGIPLSGTQAHSFVSSFLQVEAHLVGTVKDLRDTSKQEETKFLPLCKKWLQKVCPALNVMEGETNHGELVGFAAFAVAFPTNFFALLDTYEVAKSGLPNFIAVALALDELGYKPIGIRVDSGDLAYLSKFVRGKFELMAEIFEKEFFHKLIIVASNDINEETLYSLKQQGHSIDGFGIGTHLVTCQRQPALGCVYKLVEIDGKPRMKISEEVNKVTIPGKKTVYRLYGNDGKALIDLIQKVDEDPPSAEKRVLCRHPNFESKRAYVIPKRVDCLLKEYYWKGKYQGIRPTLPEIRQNVLNSLNSLREDHLRPLNPTPYKVSLSDNLYNYMHELWLESAPIGELS